MPPCPPLGGAFDPRCPPARLGGDGGVHHLAALPPDRVTVEVGVASASERRSQSAIRWEWASVAAAAVVVGIPPWPAARPAMVDGSVSLSDNRSSRCSAAAAREPRKRRSLVPPAEFTPLPLPPPLPPPLLEDPPAPPGMAGTDAGPSCAGVLVEEAFHQPRSLVGSPPMPRPDRETRRGKRLPDFANRSVPVPAADTSAAAALAAAAAAALAVLPELPLDARKKRRGDRKTPSSMAVPSLPSRRLSAGGPAWRPTSSSSVLSSTTSLGLIRSAASVRAACMAAAAARRRLAVARRLAWSRCVRSLVA
ncbi:hypothetical protein BU14_0285s0012 [Porphyra umbilicalis]|uniref:Uncharacterized protein n=1 Tax=Porphyra umbilicalis TaxID=2786 RepID=A0A1X6P0Y9_PORUM|nr:hypothetical protein BU14_0285s0012 [Porphyra umbilicalis]|eukprot:OSX74524.1 hypothetical protein BU14_0285s0012 [Porphyra umbilicalis]